MPTMSFTEPTAEAPAEKQELAKAPDTTTALKPMEAGASTGVEGDIEVKDLNLPRLNLVQKMSDLSNTFRPGDIVFDKTARVGGVNAPFKATVLRLKKQFQEDLPYGSEIMPRVFNTRQEVFANGGSLQYGDQNFFTEVAHIQLAVEAPAEIPDAVADLFAHEFDGKFYAKAIVTVSKSNYGSLAKPLITAAFETLRDGLFHGSYEIRSVEKKSPKGTYFVYSPVFKGRHSKEAAEFFQSLL